MFRFVSLLADSLLLIRLTRTRWAICGVWRRCAFSTILLGAFGLGSAGLLIWLDGLESCVPGDPSPADPEAD